MSEPARSSFVSTGSLPSPAIVRAELDEAHARLQENRDGECSNVYPALARVSPDLFGMCVVGTSGRVHAVGDTDHRFTIMSLGLARFHLDLIPSHPDRRGGIAFLRRPSVGYCAALLFAVSSVVVAEWGQRLVAGDTLAAFKPLLLLFAVGGVLIAFGPLFAFTPQLFRARYVGLIEASAFASRFSRNFRERTLKHRGEELRLSRDVQGLVALGQGYRDTVEQMRLVLFEKKDLLVLLAATLAPLLPAMLMSVPREEWALLASLVTGSAMP